MLPIYYWNKERQVSNSYHQARCRNNEATHDHRNNVVQIAQRNITSDNQQQHPTGDYVVNFVTNLVFEKNGSCEKSFLMV